MKYIKLFEDIDWDWVQEEKNPHKEIPYEKDGVIYGKTIHIYKIDISDLKFQLEDKVMCVKDGNDRIVEKIGKVVDYYSENYLIYFDDNIRGHGQNNIPSGHAWYVKEKYLKKI